MPFLAFVINWDETGPIKFDPINIDWIMRILPFGKDPIGYTINLRVEPENSKADTWRNSGQRE